MRVVLRTPAELVTEYHLPGIADPVSDEQLLAAAQQEQPIADGEFVIVGEPYVYARGLDDLAAQGHRIQHAEQLLGEAKAAAVPLAQRAFDQGASKGSIAAALGITRPTLDAWLGDSRRVRRVKRDE